MPSSSSSSSSVPQLKILRAYAKLDDASLQAATLPPTVYFSHTRHTLTVFDAYPKALFHFLVLPRLRRAPAATPKESNHNHNGDHRAGGGRELEVKVVDSAEDLTSLRALLQRAAASNSRSRSSLGADREDADADADDVRARARGTLRVLADEAARLRGEIEREMLAHYGFTWPIWAGFHAVPSME